MIIFVVLAISAAVELQDKEDFCFNLASAVQKNRVRQFKEFLKEHPEFSKRDLYTRVVEDNFYKCLELAKDEDVEKEMAAGGRFKNLNEYLHLVEKGLEQYVGLKRIENSDKFMRKRHEINNRIAKEKFRMKNEEF